MPRFLSNPHMERGPFTSATLPPLRRLRRRRGAALRWMMATVLALALAPAVVAANADVVINEIMYHPPLDMEPLQYVELFNRGSSEADLSGWSFTKGVQFEFPAGTRLAAGAFLIVCRNKPAFQKQYGADIPVAGEFSGKLSHRGEKLELADARAAVVDAVHYADQEPWPTGADGCSASLERICPFVSGSGPENWEASTMPRFEAPAGTPGRRNDSFSSHLPPAISRVQPGKPLPGQSVSVTADIADADGVKAAVLLWSIPSRTSGVPEKEVPMQRVAGDEKHGTYQASIEAQPAGTLVRFRLRAADATGAVRFDPSTHAPRPTYSYCAAVNTNTARIPFAFVLHFAEPQHEGRSRRRGERNMTAEPTRGDAAFIYMPPDGGEVLTFDHVHSRSRTDGFKVHFQKDRPLRGMTSINLLAGQYSTRWLLSEPLAFELYRRAGVPAPLTDHFRVWMDGRLMGWQLMVEQPNKSFLARHQRDDTGHLYKLIWQNQGLVAQHEKKTRVTEGHDDLVAVIRGLESRTGSDQWAFIQKQFNVDEFASYYAVNMCIQNWDGFFNNYFVYHDTGGTGRWEMFPWDEDKTWGFFDNGRAWVDWYDMPLNIGMNGAKPPQWNPFSRTHGGRGPHGGPSWWRRPGWFSGPMLANPEFRQRFLARLKELCLTRFNEKDFGPVVNALEEKLEGEIAVRARAEGQDPAQALKTFRSQIQSFHKQLKHRREFILDELSGTRRVLKSPWLWIGLVTLVLATGFLVGVWCLWKSVKAAAARRPPPLRAPPVIPGPPPLPGSVNLAASPTAKPPTLPSAAS